MSTLASIALVTSSSSFVAPPTDSAIARWRSSSSLDEPDTSAGSSSSSPVKSIVLVFGLANHERFLISSAFLDQPHQQRRTVRRDRPRLAPRVLRPSVRLPVVRRAIRRGLVVVDCDQRRGPVVVRDGVAEEVQQRLVLVVVVFLCGGRSAWRRRGVGPGGVTWRASRTSTGSNPIDSSCSIAAVESILSGSRRTESAPLRTEGSSACRACRARPFSIQGPLLWGAGLLYKVQELTTWATVRIMPVKEKGLHP